MAGNESNDAPKLKVEDILLQFFTKDIPLDDHANKSKSKDHKKHKSKSKKKRLRRDSSCSDSSGRRHKKKSKKHRRSMSLESLDREKSKQSKLCDRIKENYRSDSRDSSSKRSKKSPNKDKDEDYMNDIERKLCGGTTETDDLSKKERYENSCHPDSRICLDKNISGAKLGQKNCSDVDSYIPLAAQGEVIEKSRSDCTFAQLNELAMDGESCSNKSTYATVKNHQDSLRTFVSSSSLDKNADSKKLSRRLASLKQQELEEKFVTPEEVHCEARSRQDGSSSSERSQKKSKRYDEDERSRRHSKHSSISDRPQSANSHDAEKNSCHQSSKERRGKHRSGEPSAGIDKEKLLEIAKRNAELMMRNGNLPEGIKKAVLRRDTTPAVDKGGEKSVREYTDFCHNLLESDDSSNHGSADTEPFIKHPFKLKEPSAIQLNIKNSIPIPVKTHAEQITQNARALTQQFPVSSGNLHRQKERYLVPVKSTNPKSARISRSYSTIVPTTNTHEPTWSPPVQYIPPARSPPNDHHLPTLSPPPADVELPVISPPPWNPNAVSAPVPTMPFTKSSEMFSSLFPVGSGMEPSKSIDVQAVVVKHYMAREKLQRNPLDLKATNDLHTATLQLQDWVKSKQQPGQFTGSSDVRFLSAEELSGPHPAWVKKNTFLQAAPVTDGKGMRLLKKMGWNPGEGLGKNKEGSLEPVMMDIKMDKKGLVSVGESAYKGSWSGSVHSCNKHPVSVLMELCSKKKWQPPNYVVVTDSGPPHKKLFLFKVQVNNKEFQPTLPRSSKKQAKADAAILCLQSMGVLSTQYIVP